MNLKRLIVNYFPFLGPVKRLAHALVDVLLPAKSYSQHGEDTFIIDFLSKNNQLNGVYIDVGANHPTSISNTYLLYRKGLSGISIEPNGELARLHRWFRKRDKVCEIGVDNQCGMFEFNISKTPVLSSFKKIEGQGLWKTQNIPVLRLDDVTSFAKPERVFLLNIDTEGLNYNVIQGADQTLDITYLVCIEFESASDEALITEYLTQKHHFRKIKKMGCNLLFVNEGIHGP